MLAHDVLLLHNLILFVDQLQPAIEGLPGRNIGHRNLGSSNSGRRKGVCIFDGETDMPDLVCHQEEVTLVPLRVRGCGDDAGACPAAD